MTDWRSAATAAVLCGGGALAFLTAVHAPAYGWVPRLAFVQTGDSMPRGLYLYAHAAPVARGEVVVVRNPPHFPLGWLMKRAAGVAGDRFCWDAAARTHRLNDRPMPPPLPASWFARHGKPAIPVWRGCRRLGPGELVGYGDTQDSYDSRYLGPVREDALWGVYRAVTTW